MPKRKPKKKRLAACRLCKVKNIGYRNDIRISKYCPPCRDIKKQEKLEKKKTTKSWFKKEYKRLHNKAWPLFSKYVRYKEAVNGYAPCYTCDAIVNCKTEANAGHYFHGKLDFDERNVKNQCIKCNHHKSGAGALYGVKLAQELGADGLQQLKLDAYSVEYTLEDLEAIIEKYEALNKTLF